MLAASRIAANTTTINEGYFWDMVKHDRVRQRATLRALDVAREALQATSEAGPARDAAYQRYHDALRDYWSCHNIRNSRRLGISLTE
jgi:hypothetical protein